MSRIFARSITYLHSGSRVRGLKRDPATYLKSPAGLNYTEVSPAYQQELRQKLQLDSSISDDVLLQCMTHKSFAHGSKPYNEKLAVLGAHALKFHASVHTVQSSEGNINGCDFGALGSVHGKLLFSKKVASEYIKKKGVDQHVFWKQRDALANGQYNGEETVLATTLHAIIGGLMLQGGQEKVSEFVKKELLNTESQDSLVNIANSL